MQTQTVNTTLGELVSALYEALLEELGDAELAAVVTSTLVEERLIDDAMADEVAAA